MELWKFQIIDSPKYVSDSFGQQLKTTNKRMRGCYEIDDFALLDFGMPSVEG